MRLYEYLIGGKKTGQIEDLKDVIPECNPFRELKTGESFFISQFRLDGTHVYTAEIEITSIVKKHTGWVFTGLTKKGVKYAYSVEMGVGDLDKKLAVLGQGECYKAFSTFKMDDKPLFELVKKEIKNSKK